MVLLKFKTYTASPFAGMEQEGEAKPPASVAQVALFRWAGPTFRFHKWLFKMMGKKTRWLGVGETVLVGVAVGVAVGGGVPVVVRVGVAVGGGVPVGVDVAVGVDVGSRVPVGVGVGDSAPVPGQKPASSR
jgi:hypothetical protein